MLAQYVNCNQVHYYTRLCDSTVNINYWYVSNIPRHSCFEHTETQLFWTYRDTAVLNILRHSCFEHTETAVLNNHAETRLFWTYWDPTGLNIHSHGCFIHPAPVPGICFIVVMESQSSLNSHSSRIIMSHSITKEHWNYYVLGVLTI